MKKKIITCLLTFLLFACSATTGNLKLETSESGIKNQMAGLTTKAEVREKFGRPDLVFEKNGQEYYEYKTITGSGRYHFLLPLIGWVMSWFQDTYTYEETNLFIGFDKADKISDYNVIQTGGTMN